MTPKAPKPTEMLDEFLERHISYGEPRDWNLYKQGLLELINAAQNQVLDMVKAEMPKTKTLETDTPLDSYDDDTKFCVECGQFEYEGVLSCQCVGFNQAITEFTAAVEKVRGNK